MPKKGFTITPIVFVGLFIVIGLMMIGFGDIDRKAVNGIEKDSRVRNLGYRLMSDEISKAELLYIYSAESSVGSATKQDIQNNITRLIGQEAHITDCTTGHYTVYYNKSYSAADVDVSINTTRNILKNITCGDIYSLNLATPNPISINCGSETFFCPQK